MRIQFELPGLPKMTNPSGAKSTHWRVVKAERDRWKYLVSLVTKSQRPPVPWEFAKLTCTRFSSSSPDADGLVSGFKAIIDGLVECGVLKNDRWQNIGMPNYCWKKCKPKMGKVEVVVEQLAESPYTDEDDSGSFETHDVTTWLDAATYAPKL